MNYIWQLIKKYDIDVYYELLYHNLKIQIKLSKYKNLEIILLIFSQEPTG